MFASTGGRRGTHTRRLLRLVCLLSLFGWVLTSQGHASPAGCNPHGSHTLFANRDGRVYSSRFIAFGCLFSVGRRVRLGIYSTTHTAGNILRERKYALVGRYVGFERYLEGKTDEEYTVHVVDLRSGRTVHQAPSGTPTQAETRQPESYHGVGHVTRLLLRRSGSIAWIAGDTAYSRYFEVHVIDASGNRLLDGGSDVEPHYLRLTSTAVLWSRGGTRKHAPFR